MSAIERTEVLVVGAGPTGLTAAVRLAQLGVPHIVLDARAEPTLTSNAALVHASSLELLAQVGVGDDLVAAGRKLHRIVMTDRGRPLVRIDLTRLRTRYPFALGVPQSTTEDLLIKRLSDLGGSVRRPVRVDAVEQDGDEVLVSAGAARFQARYVIGADGSHSAVRSAIGVEFRGETYPSQFVLADIGLSGEQPSDQATINMSADGVTVLAQLPSGNYRIVATVGGEAPESPDRAFVDALLRARRIPFRTVAEPVWSSRFRIHHRVAESFRAGNVFLAGDAAHVHSPAAGQGMNTGIADAYDLATKLASRADLEAYARVRQQTALEVVRFTDRMTRIAQLSNPAARTVRRVVAGTAGRLHPVQNRIATWVTGLERSPLRQ
jgi:2-polyprenyl-6-methoxyphenol hydroxylase-like FAD-dependent oxidoreductase